MAGAIIIACGIGILLLVLTGYVLVGGTLSSADSYASAQKDMALEKDEQVHTAIQISNVQCHKIGGGYRWTTFDLQNIGSTPIGDFNRTDIIINDNGTLMLYSFNGVVSGNTPGINTSRTWGYMTITPDTTHPYMLDPGETMTVNITNFLWSPSEPKYLIVNATTPNGATAVNRRDYESGCLNV